MKLRRAALLSTFSALAALGTVGVTAASADTVWNLDLHHNETHFAPGDDGEYWVGLRNVGDTASAGTITVTIDLPAGLSRKSVRRDQASGVDLHWNCPGSAGDTVITCTGSGSVPGHDLSENLTLTVNADPLAVGDLLTTATVSGGGAFEAPAAAACPPGVAACASELTPVDAVPAPFGIVEESFIADFYQADGVTPMRASGDHPDLATFAFDFKTIDGGLSGNGDPQKVAAETLRNISVDLPPGFIGNPTAVGECAPAELLGGGAEGICPPSSQVGVADVTIFPPTSAFNRSTEQRRPVFNMSHPLGSVSQLAFRIAGIAVHVRVSLNPANSYAITSKTADINETVPAYHAKVSIWGVPGDSSHDSERLGGATGQIAKPFLTVPFQCGVDHQMRAHHYDSWQNPGVFGADINYTMPGHTTECDIPSFDPSVELNPTGRQANTPTGLDVSIQIDQNDNPNAVATPPVKSTVVTFPEGMTFNPAFSDGLDGCTLAQIGLGTNDPVACPDNSRIGEVFLTTPLLPKPLEGSMYIAKQGDNFFGSTFAMYMAVHDTEQRGVLVKIPGRIDVDPVTGQITTTFDDLPQFPFDDFTLSFRSGQRAPLVNPPVCGTQRIGIVVTSYAQPNRELDASNSYQINEGPNGTACPASSNSRPFNPQMNAGTQNPAAGRFSSFIFRLTRSDTEQDLSKVTTVLPPGLTGKLAGVSACPESAIASISTAEGAGRAEDANPSCPANSLVGVLNTGVGAGTNPNYFKGKVYLAGPYGDAPVSFAIVVPAIAGLYDFGNVVVRSGVYLDPRTGQVKAVTDPLPPVVHGILLHVRDIRLITNRENFTLNPTNCSPMSVDASIFSDLGALASPSTPFQAAECASLGFKPKILMRLRGGTKRGAHPALTATLIPREGDANIASLSVAFPRSEFLENAHIRTVCTRADFAASNCPEGAIYGRATATTPLLDYPLQANVYLRSSSNLLPDVVPDFRGPVSQPLRFESAGRVDSINGGIRNTFDLIPDAPITKVLFQLQGGKKGLLVNSRDICARTYRATVKYTAQNGRTYTARPKMQANCGRKAKRGKKRRGHSRTK
jgi:hypothetical protein